MFSLLLVFFFVPYVVWCLSLASRAYLFLLRFLSQACPHSSRLTRLTRHTSPHTSTHDRLFFFYLTYCLRPLFLSGLLRGTIVSRTYGTHKKPFIFPFFNNNIWSYLLWPPVIVLVVAQIRGHIVGSFPSSPHTRGKFLTYT